MPKFIWLENRREAIESAIARYEEVKMHVPLSWVTELEELNKICTPRK